VFEVESQVVIARSLNYCSAEEAEPVLNRIVEVGRILSDPPKSLDDNANGLVANPEPLATTSHALWFPSRIPFRHEIGVYQPLDRRKERADSDIHMLKVDVRDVIAGLMIITM
jgi:hypothetical protein